MTNNSKPLAPASETAAAELTEAELAGVSGAEITGWEKVQELRSGAHAIAQTKVKVFVCPSDPRG